MEENVKLTYSYYFSFLEDSAGALDEMGKMQEMFSSVRARADKRSEARCGDFHADAYRSFLVTLCRGFTLCC